MTRLPAHTLLVTYLHDAALRRGTSIDHLCDLLAPIPERNVRSWFDGTSSPSILQLPQLAEALRLDFAELIIGWMIDRVPEIEARVRPFTLDPLGSSFPRSTDLNRRAPRLRTDMKVPDPFDERRPVIGGKPPVPGAIRKRASNVGGRAADSKSSSGSTGKKLES